MSIPLCCVICITSESLEREWKLFDSSMAAQHHTALITVDVAFWDSDKKSYLKDCFYSLIPMVTLSPSIGYFHFPLREVQYTSWVEKSGVGAKFYFFYFGNINPSLHCVRINWLR